ncbi:class I glutamine amidotransferase-like protein [Nadsonia fulvescens var. elongata DSM 6958]|uniref:Class I glutamine amidotransferase-like protein n=1 Tax=Nadsonia fulvescens var. elongata DSM 6958 TaxID=857566 RepID=A0A1E3PH03_9ASCO|nr:class I glutamine amidotransferase-like protein [Nadsonia fulvescens var. elongata DSM 6958]
MHIAILETDRPLPAIEEANGSYGVMFAKLLQLGGFDLLNPENKVSTWDVVKKMEYPDLSNVDGIIITGSKYTANDKDYWIVKLVNFVTQALKPSEDSPDNQRVVPIVGICFGHQIVGRALGAPLGRNHQGWEVSICQTALTDVGAAVFPEIAQLSQDKPYMSICQMHQDIIKELPEDGDYQLLASSDACAIQGLYKPDEVLTLQGHPEYNESILREFVKARGSLWSEELTKDAESRLKSRNDSALIAKSIVRFLNNAVKNRSVVKTESTRLYSGTIKARAIV